MSEMNKKREKSALEEEKEKTNADHIGLLYADA